MGGGRSGTDDKDSVPLDLRPSPQALELRKCGVVYMNEKVFAAAAEYHAAANSARPPHRGQHMNGQFSSVWASGFSRLLPILSESIKALRFCSLVQVDDEPLRGHWSRSRDPCG